MKKGTKSWKKDRNVISSLSQWAVSKLIDLLFFAPASTFDFICDAAPKRKGTSESKNDELIDL